MKEERIRNDHHPQSYYGNNNDINGKNFKDTLSYIAEILRLLKPVRVINPPSYVSLVTEYPVGVA